MSKMTTLTYNPNKSIIIKDVIILTLMNNTFNLYDTDITICAISFLLNGVDKTFLFYFRIYNTV